MRRSRFEPCAGNNIFFHFYCLRLGLLLINPRNIIGNIVMIFLNNFKGSWSATHVLLPRGWGAYVSPLLQYNQCTMFIRKNKIIIIILNKIIISTTNLAACVCVSSKFDQFLPLRLYFVSKRPENFVRIAKFPYAAFGALFAFHCPLFVTKNNNLGWNRHRRFATHRNMQVQRSRPTVLSARGQ